MAPRDHIITVFHYARDPTRYHGVPFRVIVRPGDTVSDVKQRIKTRLAMNDKDFAKIKVSLVSYGSRMKPLEDGACYCLWIYSMCR